MKKQYRWLALAVSCILACSMPVSAVCGEAEAPAGAGDTEAAAEAAAEDPGMLPVILGAVFAFVVGNLLIARSRKKQQKKDED